MSNTVPRSDGIDEHHDGELDASVNAHLAEVEDGAGCTEIWETLSERRGDDADADRATE